MIMFQSYVFLVLGAILKKVSTAIQKSKTSIELITDFP